MSSDSSSRKPYLTAPIPTENLPGGIPYIIGNEAAERFSFYGMKGILVIFMTQYLHLLGSDPNAIQMGSAEATEHYHSFTGWVYFLPIVGAVLSDTLLGKYRTILYLSVVYCLGHLCLALMGSGGMSAGWWLALGLGMVALGSGGIKPCVSAHVGDQFGKTNAHWLSKVFSWFYFSINLGAFLSTMLTPWLLEWFGPHWAFGVPGVLMAIATVVFWMGRTKFIHVPPGGTQFLSETFSSDGIKCLLKLGIIYLFVAVFWALFDQTGSTWVLQASDLDRNFLGFEWLPSQIQAVNPIFILILIPIFSYLVYPAIDVVFPLTPIRKISIGLFVMIGGFAIVSWLQQQIDNGYRPSIAWQLLAYAVLTSSEVMVSITALEFSYTQAPRKMKSVVMALFLMSVALGNFFTMGVNAFIQVPNQVEKVRTEHKSWFEKREELSASELNQLASAAVDGNGARMLVELNEDFSCQYTVAGTDGEFETDDDFRVVFDETGAVTEVVTVDNASLEQARTRIEEHFRTNDQQLPQTESAAEILTDLTDSRGNELVYRLATRDTFYVTSVGADGELLTMDDVILQGTVTRPVAVAEAKKQSSWTKTLEAITPEQPWRTTRLRELKGDVETSEQADGVEDETKLSSSISVGGGTRLEGAPYFWFWTWLMAGTAVLFVFVAYLYKPREYLQEEGEAAH